KIIYQAEDGIRDRNVTGVQTCALPILTEDNWFGHTLITGNVGTGKTVLQRLLSISMLHLGHVIVVIDPKNDAEWRQSLMDEASRSEERSVGRDARDRV